MQSLKEVQIFYRVSILYGIKQNRQPNRSLHPYLNPFESPSVMAFDGECLYAERMVLG